MSIGKILTATEILKRDLEGINPHCDWLNGQIQMIEDLLYNTKISKEQEALIENKILEISKELYKQKGIKTSINFTGAKKT